MATIKERMRLAEEDGYLDENAEARVCQDIVLKALSVSSLSRNATIKGGVVMRSITGDSRRATLDMDIDFIKYSLDDSSIERFIEKLNSLPDLKIEQVGIPTELKQQDYHGKRVYIRITDETGDSIESKLDIGVHKHVTIEQEEYCFDIAQDDEGASLLINTMEQMFAEKLRALLKFANNSTRYKDIFDMCYLSNHLDKVKLKECFDEFIFKDPEMREENIYDIIRRVNQAFSNEQYLTRLSRSRQNWLKMEASEVTKIIINFLLEIHSEVLT